MKKRSREKLAVIIREDTGPVQVLYGVGGVADRGTSGARVI